MCSRYHLLILEKIVVPNKQEPMTTISPRYFPLLRIVSDQIKPKTQLSSSAVQKISWFFFYRLQISWDQIGNRVYRFVLSARNIVGTSLLCPPRGEDDKTLGRILAVNSRSLPLMGWSLEDMDYDRTWHAGAAAVGRLAGWLAHPHICNPSIYPSIYFSPLCSEI